MMIIPQIIEYGSEDYKQMVALRHRVLREPLRLTFSKDDLEKDKDDFLLTLFMQDTHQMIACCILTPIDEKTVKLRQMAVDSTIHKSGIGTSMLSFAEYVATKENFSLITIHAREVAVGFYLKYDYKIVGNKFEEVGIPHYKMEKQLNRQ